MDLGDLRIPLAMRPAAEQVIKLSTLGQKAKQVRDMLKMTWATPEFLRTERIDDTR